MQRKPIRGAVALATAFVAALATASCTTAEEPRAAHPSTAGTTAASRPLPRDWTCRGGAFRWGEVTRQMRLAAVSDARHVRVPAGKTVRSTFRLVPLRTLRATVYPPLPEGATAGQAAVDSLADRTDSDLARVGDTFALSEGDRTLTVSSGRSDGVLVAAVGVTTVEAPFVYSCGASGGGTVRGTVSTWSSATYSGLFACGIREGLPELEIEAQALMCGQGGGT
ncbi:hypothetical protein [Streptomyces sp. NPDC058739]|uniref:hypothetical protein n=1 Tax=Streptomyces sp. NPDC058739 TaxID=3346618 RepID=UPI0036C30B21